VSALKSIATAGDTRERNIANRALGTALENIGERYNVDNQYEQAENAYKEALELKERTVASDDPDIPRALDKLAEIYRAHGKLRAAESLMERSLAVKEKIYGPDDPAVAGSLKSLAELYRLEGKSGDAEQLTRRAIAIDEKVARPRNPEASADAPQALPGVEAGGDNSSGESKPAGETDLVKPAATSEGKEATGSSGLEM
jgi:tetratricopeptide (TPR) repeat protein